MQQNNRPPARLTIADIDKLRQTLEAGRKLCEADGTLEPSNAEIVWRLFREAADTFNRLPDRERSWLNSGNRVAWPSIVYDAEDQRQAQEQYDVELARVQSGQDAQEAARVNPGPPERAAIGRATVIGQWHLLLAGNERVRDWKILWLLASGKLTAKIISKECGCSVRTVWNVREWQCRVISQRLLDVV